MALFNYESEQIFEKVHGDNKPQGKHFVADCKQELLNGITPNYPQLSDYEKEWMYFGDKVYVEGQPVNLEYATVEGYEGTIYNAIPFNYKRAILKGSTKYRDIDTGDILDTFDETKNLELVSVKMPVLKTTGKNLFDGAYIEDKFFDSKGVIQNSINWAITKNYIKVKPNTTYTQNIIMSTSLAHIVYYDENYVIVGTSPKIEYTFTTPINCSYIKTCYDYSSVGHHNFQIEEGSTKTLYEPYKSNILSTSEDVELRGIGKVKDELNLLTGEVVRNIGEVVVNGSENFIYPAPNVYRVLVPDIHSQNNSIFVCDTMPTTSWENYTDESYDGYVYQTKEGFNFIQYKRTEEEFKEFLQKNPITFQYQLAEKSIKTVDLSHTIKPQEGTNYYTSTAPMLLECPVVSTGAKTLYEISQEE